MIALKQILQIGLLFYAFLLIFLYIQQKKFIFFPTQTKHQPDSREIIEFSVTNENELLHGWLVNSALAGEQLIIYYGGNAEDVYFSRDEFSKYTNSATLLMNYRGYSSSTGSPGEKEIFSDALAIYDEIKTKYSPSKIFLMGRSLGSGVATYVAAHREIDGMILVTPYDSIESIAKKQFPYVPVSFLLKHKFRSIDYIAQNSAPLLIIYGGRDRTIPPAHTRQLIQHTEENTEVIFIEEAEHNNIEMFDEYTLAILEFIQ